MILVYGAPDYDPQIIEQFAAKLYGKASAFLVGSVSAGVMLGAGFGAVPLTSLGEHWPVPGFLGFATMLLGALLGGLVGYVVGDTRAFGYRLQAQSALCQLEVERNTAETAALLSKAMERKPQPAPKPAPAPARAAAPAPPVAVPAPQPPPARVEPPLSAPTAATG